MTWQGRRAHRADDASSTNLIFVRPPIAPGLHVFLAFVSQFPPLCSIPGRRGVSGLTRCDVAERASLMNSAERKFSCKPYSIHGIQRVALTFSAYA